MPCALRAYPKTRVWPRTEGASDRFPNKHLIYVNLASVALQFVAYGLQEATGTGSIQDAVIERETQVHHRTYSNRIVFHHHRPLDDSIHAENSRMGLEDDAIAERSM